MIGFGKSAAAAGIAVLFVGPAWGASTITRTSSFTYDAAGTLLQEVVEPDNPTYRLQTAYSYDGCGNKVSVTVSGQDITTRTSRTVMDSRCQFPKSSSNALGQSENYQYDTRFGQTTSQTGPNGLTTKWVFDTFGRKTQETRPDGTITKWSYDFCSPVALSRTPGTFPANATCVSGAKYVVTQTPYASGGTAVNGPWVKVYYDRLDRELARETQGFGSATATVGGVPVYATATVRAVTVYNTIGRVTQTSRPYMVSGGTPQYTNFTYDALGRVLKQTGPDGGVSQTVYNGLTVTETNALNQTRTTTKNSQGNVISVKDALNNTMTFTYDAVGNLLTTRDAAGNVVSATYDLRGRKVTSVDPDLGTWTFSYNTLDKLVKQTDAKGQVTTLTYDLLGRMTQRVEPTATSTWTYDTASKGKLASSAITVGAGKGFIRNFLYDSYGRPTQVATTIDGATYKMSATYDANSRINKVIYPSGFTARYDYTALGYAYRLVDDATGKAQWTGNAMDADGHFTQVTSGNNLVTNTTFDVKTGLATNISTGSNSVQNLTYTYDKLGNPTSRRDTAANFSETFTYDALSRLTSATVDMNRVFSYNAIGNMLSKADLGTYSYPAAGQPRPHAVTSVTGNSTKTTFTYDANGNQTSAVNQAVASFGGRLTDQTIAARSISYTSYNKPASITQGTRTISFVDDPEHQRFKQVTPEGTTLYISAFGVTVELANPGTTSAMWRDYLSIGNVKVGMRVTIAGALATRYFHTDNLGSISVITNEAGAVLERLNYDAWGQRRNPNGTVNTTGSITSQTTRGFTGEEMLSVGSLVHLNGRVYDALLGRFTSPDPFVPGPMNMQAWNRYSYVYNDPLAFTDPNGFCGFFCSAWHQVIRPVVGIVVAVVVTIACDGGCGGAVWSAVLAGASGGAAQSAANGGNFGQIVKGAAIGGVTAYGFYEVGSLTYGNVPGSAAYNNIGSAAYFENIAGHALVGCASSAVSGGSCKSGALSGAVGSALAPMITNNFPNPQTNTSDLIGGTITSSVAGGLASVAGGGKFGNGAYTAAFGYLFNATMHEAWEKAKVAASGAMSAPLSDAQRRLGESLWAGFSSPDIYGGGLPPPAFLTRLEGAPSDGEGMYRLFSAVPAFVGTFITTLKPNTWGTPAGDVHFNYSSNLDNSVPEVLYWDSRNGGYINRRSMPESWIKKLDAGINPSK